LIFETLRVGWGFGGENVRKRPDWMEIFSSSSDCDVAWDRTGTWADVAGCGSGIAGDVAAKGVAGVLAWGGRMCWSQVGDAGRGVWGELAGWMGSEGSDGSVAGSDEGESGTMIADA
jgi:hypothetical protein